MTDEPNDEPTGPRTPPPDADPRFAWHPESELIGIRDAAVSRAALERLGHGAWAAALDYVYDEAFRRAMGEPAEYGALRRTFFGTADGPGPARSAGPAAAPTRPTPSAALLDEFRTRVAPYQLNAYHPRSLSYFTPPPLAMSVVGELLAQVTQQGVDVWHAGPSGAFVEEEVIRWLTDLVGYPTPPSVARPGESGAGAGAATADQPGGGAFGILTSGGVMANFLAMALARDIHLPALTGSGQAPRGRALEGIRVYTSDQTHFSIARALDELGFPDDTLVVIPTGEDFRLRGVPVAAAIEADRAAGLRPLAICAVAGSTNTGSIDALDELADVAEREGLWFHVDAAYGGAVRLSERLADRLPDLHRADSVTVDPHKWFFQAYDIGALLVRRRRDLTDTFHRAPEYYRGGGSGRDGAADDLETVQLNFYQHGMEGTRRWRALKLWMSWKHLGTSGLARLVEANVEVAGHLARRIAESDDFDAFPVEPPLSVVCFRHLPAGRRATAGSSASALVALDDHQDRLALALEASGDGWLSTTLLRGRTYLRAGIVNYLTTEDDIDHLLETLRRLGGEGAPDR
ncbi:MAG TPA: pyridoxal-dependent decarboxylase [Candidatus Limnocylindrales bacterium]